MTTHSFIGIEDESESISGVYCHYDGYIDSVGAMLKNHYTNRKKLKSLISLGSLSTLNKEIGQKHTLGSAEAVKNNWTHAYTRDRNEPLVIKKYNSMYDISNEYEYAYVYTNKGYWLYRHNFGKSSWLPL